MLTKGYRIRDVYVTYTVYRIRDVLLAREEGSITDDILPFSFCELRCEV